jgi:hypothetical protein
MGSTQVTKNDLIERDCHELRVGWVGGNGGCNVPRRSLAPTGNSRPRPRVAQTHT